MKIIIPIDSIRERLLPYDEMFKKSNVSPDMIYNVACYAIQTCIENKNFTVDFVKDKADLHSWEIFSETVMESFGEDLSYQQTEATLQLCSKAVVETALEITNFIKKFDNELCDKIIQVDGYIVPEEDNHDNLILEIVGSQHGAI